MTLSEILSVIILSEYINKSPVLMSLVENMIINKLEWAELNQAETVRLQVYTKLCFQV